MVQQTNYDEYKIAKMKDSPIINVRIIDSEYDPSGGDAGLPPTPPAITNAIFAATGKRIRKLPIGKQKLIWNLIPFILKVPIIKGPPFDT